MLLSKVEVPLYGDFYTVLLISVDIYGYGSENIAQSLLF